jgi:hypothetical protein
MKSVRAALWPLRVRAQQMATPEMLERLETDLGLLGLTRTGDMLHRWRPPALQLARAGTARQWQKLLDQHPVEQRHLVLYATAAWITRTLVLAESLEQSDLAALPQKWAADQTLSLVEAVEGDEAWLWPFESEPPWPLSDDEE